MDDFEKMLVIFGLFLILIIGSVVLVITKVAPPQSTSESMHNVMEGEQRDVTAGGAGISGGTNPYLATTIPFPSPTARR